MSVTPSDATSTALVPLPSKPRKTLAPRLRSGDHEFLPAALEILEAPPSPVRLAIILVICTLAVVALAWAYFGRVDIIAVAQGKIQPVGRTKIIQPLETGQVERLAVQNGDHVKAGDVLVDLDPRDAKADEAALTASLQALKAEMARRKVTLQAAEAKTPEQIPPITFDPDTPADVVRRERSVLVGDLGQLASAIASLRAQLAEKVEDRDRLTSTIASEKTLIAVQQQRVDMRLTLVQQNVGSRVELLNAQESIDTQRTYLAGLQGQLMQAGASIQTAMREIDRTYGAFIADNAQKLAEAERRADDTQQRLDKARIKTSHMELTSPLEGTVQGLSITNVGQVVTTGQEIMQIVPGGRNLEIQAYLPNEDIGFVKVGQTALIKIESFPFTRYGTLEATVTHIADDAIPEPDAQQREGNPATPNKTVMFGGAQRTQNLVFPITLKMAHSVMDADGVEVPLIPGMAVTTEIKTGNRRILGYIFSPVIQVTSRAMKER